MQIRTLFFWISLFATLLAGSCGGDKEQPEEPTREHSKAPEVMAALWKTSPEAVDATRKELFATIQGYADRCSATNFKKYLSASKAVADDYERYEDAYAAYRTALDRVLKEVRTTTVAPGSAVIWHLYNMGYVVKTPSGCFGIDLFHRHAAELASDLNFLCITHNHQDHYTTALVEVMQRAGKPVLSNHLAPGPYTSKQTADYTIGSFSLHTFISSHNNDTAANVDVTVFQITCGDNSGGLRLLHVGDSNYRPEQYDVTTPIDVMIPRYAPNALTENNIIGKTVAPKYVLLSHILELTHTDPAASRWTLEQGLARAAQLDCENTWMPFWGEKFVWKDGKLTKP